MLETHQNISISAPATFKCDFCSLCFLASSDQNLHLLDHFQRINCTICQQSIILIGNTWYGPHQHQHQNQNHNHEQHVNQDRIKSELDTNDADENRIEPLILPDFVEITPSDPFLFRNENYTPYTESFNRDAIKSENELFNDIQTDEQLAEPNHFEVDTVAPQTSDDTVDGIRGTENQIDVSNEENQMNVDDIEMKESNENQIDNPNKDLSESDDETNAADEKKRRKFCNICNKQFTCGTGFKYHMNIHLGIKYSCDLCDKSYTDKRHLNSHKLTHELKEQIDGDIDDYVEVPVGKKTKLTKEQLNNLLCPICNRTFTLRKSLRDHFAQHNRSRYGCKWCKKTFRDVNSYKRHRLAIHKNEPPNKKTPTIEVTVRNLGDEENVQNAIDWVCEYCNNDFEFELRLAKHIIKEHHVDKPEHSCNICGAKFNHPNELLAHMRAHPESTQHKCTSDGCQQGFRYRFVF